MRITGLHIERFGIWSGLKLDRLPKGVCVFYGPNEAGKTTLLQFLRSMLFGYFDDVREYVVSANDGGGLLTGGARGGGSLSLVAGNSEYHVRRYVSLTHPEDRAGDLRVTTQPSERVGAHRLTTLLNGLDEVVFNHVFAVGLHELQQLATLDATEASRQLYQLSTGTDRVSLVDVTRQLHAVRDRLLGGTEEDDSYLGQLLEEQRRCATKLARFDHLQRYVHSMEESRRLHEELNDHGRRRNELALEIKLAELALAISPAWKRRQDRDRELVVLGKPRPIPADAIPQWRELARQLELVQVRETELETKRARIQEALQRQEAPDGWARISGRITAILEQQANPLRAAENLRRLRERKESLELELEEETDRVGKLAASDQSKARLDPSILTAILPLAEQWQQDRDTLDKLKQETARNKQELERLERGVRENLAREPELFDPEDSRDVIQALKKTSVIATRLKQGIQDEAKRKELEKRIAKAESRDAHLLRTQLLPWEIIQALGFLFSLGTFLLLIALFSERLGLSALSRGGFAWMGGIAVAVAASIKLILELTGKEERQHWRALADRARHELRRLDEIAKSAGETGPPSRRTGPIRLEDAQRRLSRLEAVLPQEELRRQTRQEVERLELKTSQLAARAKESQRAWEESLTGLGLSPRLTPEDVRKLLAEAGKLVPLQRQLAEIQEPLRVAESEWSAWDSRIGSLAKEAGVTAAGTVAQTLAGFSAVVEKVDRDRAQREIAKDQLRAVREEVQETQREMRQLSQRQAAILRQASALDIAELEQRVEHMRQAEVLRRERDEAQAEIARILGETTESEVTQVAEATPADALRARIMEAKRRIEELERGEKERLMRQGELEAQRNSLAADRQIPVARLEQAILQRKIEDGVAQWRVVSAMHHLLRAVYKRYERERQPDTLRDASHFLKRMSRERYTRVWTPLAEDVLLADEHTGRTLPVPQLSCGTREQVYLSLRLALVAGYARRGIEMPMILDDVLVNFDVDRTRAAAEVLVEFAQAGHQVILFTCHQHVVEIFKALNVEVRNLPTRGSPEPTTSPIPPSPPISPINPKLTDAQSDIEPVDRGASPLLLGFAGKRAARRRSLRTTVRRGRTRTRRPNSSLQRRMRKNKEDRERFVLAGF